jgi:hypothetical protein
VVHDSVVEGLVQHLFKNGGIHVALLPHSVDGEVTSTLSVDALGHDPGETCGKWSCG